MSITDKQNQPASGNTAREQAGAQTQGFGQGPMFGSSMNFSGQGLFASPMSYGVGNETYAKLRESLTDAYKQTNPGVEITLIDMDNVNEPKLHYSCILVAGRYKNAPELGYAYHILVLEATGTKLDPIRETIKQTQIEIMRVPSDALDQELMRIAENKMALAFGGKGPFYPVDGCVVPEKFNVDDKYAVEKLAFNAALACTTELEMHSPQFADLNAASAQNDSSLNINVQFNHMQVADAVDMPMRSDVLADFGNRRNIPKDNRYSVNTGDRDVKISQISGFIDLVKLEDPNKRNMFGAPQQAYGQPMMQPPFKYAARLVITNLYSNFSYTPGSVLLGIITSLAVRDNSNWMQSFRPTPVIGNEIDIRDIGAVNIEANILNETNQGRYGTKIDTKSEKFQLADLGTLINTLVQPGLIVSMDVPEAGPQTWYLGIFAAAARGNHNAYRVIYDAAVQLTNGAFQRHFPMGTPMFTDLDNRVHNGYWFDRNGQKRDIRDIDHLAVANLVGERSPELIADWDDTFLLVNDYPLEMRLNARRKMISGFTNETAVFTGFSQRLTFTSAFMKALSDAIIESGLRVAVSTPLSGSDFNNQRGVATFANEAIVAPGQTFMSPGGFGYQGPAYQYGTSGYNRW